MVKEIGDRVKRLRALAIGLLVSSSPAALGAGSAHAASQVGTSAAVQGEVFVGTGSASQKRATVNQSIFLGDKVLTKQQSALQILLLDTSVFTVGENCSMVIDKFTYDPDAGTGEMAATVAKGAFRFMSGRIGHANPTNVTLRTPSVTIGVRGTFVDSLVGQPAIDAIRKVCDPKFMDPQKLANADAKCLCDTSKADPKSATLIVLRGPANNPNSVDPQGNVTVTNNTGTADVNQANTGVFVPGKDQQICGPFPIPEELRDILDFFLRSAPTGDAVNPVDVADDPEDTEDPPPPPPDFGKDTPEVIDGEEKPPPPYDDGGGGGGDQ